MSFIEDRISELVRQQALTDIVEQVRLESFLKVRLGFTAIVLAAAPLWLVTAASPSLWHGLVLLCLLAPFFAIAGMTRGLSFYSAQLISLGAPLGVAVLLAGQGASGFALAFCGLLLAGLEAIGSGRVRIALAFCLMALVAFVTLTFAPGYVATEASQIQLVTAVFVLVGYAVAMGWAHSRTIAMAALRDRRETMRHEALAQTIGDLVLRLDRGGAVLHASAEADALFSLAPAELLGRGLFERVNVADRPLFLKTVADACDGEGTVVALVRMRSGALSENGEPLSAWIEIRVRSIRLERRRTDPQDHAAVVAIIRDVTNAKLAEERLIAAQETAERANIWKDRFLANVSHELRTPLNAIIGFAEILGNPDLAPAEPERRQEYARIIHSSGQHLLEMVNSILDMSKIDAGSFEILPEPFELPRLLDQCCDMIGLKAQQGGVALERAYPADLAEIVADKRACKQILINLLSNAVKFTPRGGAVTLSARPEGATFVICVSDTGIGISARDLRHIGDPFFQAHHDTTRAYEGTGLGLSLVRGLVGLHGGGIGVDSAPGQGTTVTIRLPAVCVGAPGQSVVAPIETSVRIGPAAAFSVRSAEVVKKIA